MEIKAPKIEPITKFKKDWIDDAKKPLFLPSYYTKNYWWIDWVMISLIIGVIGFITYLCLWYGKNI